MLVFWDSRICVRWEGVSVEVSSNGSYSSGLALALTLVCIFVKSVLSFLIFVSGFELATERVIMGASVRLGYS